MNNNKDWDWIPAALFLLVLILLLVYMTYVGIALINGLHLPYY